MKMREAKLILPLADNEGNSLSSTHDALARTLCITFGGVTVSAGRGLWLDNDKLYDEPVMQFFVAADPAPDRNAALRDIAHRFAQDARQLAVYFTDFNGEAHIDPIGG